MKYRLNRRMNNFRCSYKVCFARVLDYRRKFIEAAQRYNELSYRNIIHDDDRMTALRNSWLIRRFPVAFDVIFLMKNIRSIHLNLKSKRLPPSGLVTRRYHEVPRTTFMAKNTEVQGTGQQGTSSALWRTYRTIVLLSVEQDRERKKVKGHRERKKVGKLASNEQL